MDSQKSILVVDDESNVRESLRLILSRNYSVDVAEHGEGALDHLSSTEDLPDLILLDLVMPGIDGLGLLEKINQDFPPIPVIMLTATKTVRTAVQAMKYGAIDYLNKPYDLDELLSLIEETLVSGPSGRVVPTTVSTLKHSRPEVGDVEADFGGLVGKGAAMSELFGKVKQIAPRDTTILITGESGTGKELIAKEIHMNSSRAEGPFVAINCAAVPETLIESELFGHEKGAFTHAMEQRIGQFELAEGGTLFLDEIGELSLAVQVKMLRFLQEREFYRVGSSKPISVNTRILAATNKSLENAIEDGHFRQDLYYRINVVSLETPPLRQRKEDIERLFLHFVEKLSPLYGDRKPKISKEALQTLKTYSWPGNVRELENVTESLLALGQGKSIENKDLPLRIRNGGSRNDLKEQVLEGNLDFESAEKAFETDLILRALKQTNFVQTRAAELLGISRRILKYKMDKLGIKETKQADSATK